MKTKEFILSDELEKADWNIEDIWDTSKPSAQEVVNKIIKKFIKRDWSLVMDYVEGRINLNTLIFIRNELIGDELK